MSLTWKLASRNILRNKRRTFLTVMLLSFTLAALIFTDGFMSSMFDVMIKSSTRLYPGDGQIHQVDYLIERDGEKVIQNVDAHLTKLKNADDIASYTLRAMDFGMVSSTANNLAVQVVGIDAQLEASVSKLALGLQQGEFLQNGGNKNQILIGDDLAELLEVSLGDRLVVSVNNYGTDEIDQRLFRVSGIFSMNSNFLDEGMVFIQLPMMQEMLGIGGAVHEIAFNFYDESKSGMTDLPLWSELSLDDTKAEGWKTLMPELASILEMSQYSLIIIAAILFGVAVLGVINAMFMSIYERTYEFGVVLAIGTRRSSVFALILAEGIVLGLMSLVVGSLLGALINIWVGSVGIDYSAMEIAGTSLAEVIRPANHINQFTVLPFSVFVMTFIACLYPAIHAARIVPARALHKSL